MAIPLATTTITVYRINDAIVPSEPYEDEVDLTNYIQIGTGIRAVISEVGSEEVHGGEQVIYSGQMTCDPFDFYHTDWIVDDITGIQYKINGSATYRFFGLDHSECTLRRVVGAL